MAIGQHMAANPQHHRTMPLEQGGKRRLGRDSTAGEKLDQAPIRHRAEGSDVKEHADLLAESECRIPVRHEPTRSFSVTK